MRLDGGYAARPDLRVGPYGSTQFMSWVSKERRDSCAQASRTSPPWPPRRPPPPASTATNHRAQGHRGEGASLQEKSVAQLEALQAEEVSKATAKAGTRIASANEVLATRLLAQVPGEGACGRGDRQGGGD